MTGLEEKLLLGSAKIDCLSKEINSLVKMLFELAEHPRLWIRAHELEGRLSQFHTTFGTLEDNGCLWDIWWEENTFHARCLVYEVEDEKQVVVCAYGRNRKEPHKPSKVILGHGTHTHQLEYRHLKAGGVLEAHKYLDVLVKGMLHDFPIGIKIEPFLKAYEHRL